MNRIKLLVCFALSAGLLLTLAPLADATVLVGGVPDWNQPYTYAPPGPNPNPALPTDPFDEWCSPTAAANLFGWWEDTHVAILLGLTDRQVFVASPAYANNAAAPLDNQGLWHDGSIELGWHMDTNKWQSAPGAGGWGTAGTGTSMGAIAPGGRNYAQGAWVDATTGIQKVGFTTNIATLNWVNVPGANLAAQLANIWADYIADIDNGIPELVSFDRWVDPKLPTNPLNDGFGTVQYQYDPTWTGLGHTVTGVGYVDPVAGVLDGGELFVVHDNWGTTVMNVAVPLFAVWTGNPATSTNFWMQNDHFTVVPEPSLLLVLLSGLGMLVIRRRRA